MGFFSTFANTFTHQWKRYYDYQEAKDCRGSGSVIRRYDSASTRLYPNHDARMVIEQLISHSSDSIYQFQIGLAVNGREIDRLKGVWNTQEKCIQIDLLDYILYDYLLQFGVLEIAVGGFSFGVFNSKNLEY